MHRFRPILLTAAAAILGMIPIAPTVFWGPMAYAIMGGLAVATLLTLVFLPALYVAWFRIAAPHLEVGPEQEATPSSDGQTSTELVPMHIRARLSEALRRLFGKRAKMFDEPRLPDTAETPQPGYR